VVCIWILDISACIICKHIGDKKIMADKGLPPIADDYIDPAPTSDELLVLVASWRKLAPPKYKDLIDAEDFDTLFITERKPQGRYVWVARTMRYLDVKEKRYLTTREVRNAFDVWVKAYTA